MIQYMMKWDVIGCYVMLCDVVWNIPSYRMPNPPTKSFKIVYSFEREVVISLHITYHDKNMII
jgi:hypothetical protein